MVNLTDMPFYEHVLTMVSSKEWVHLTLAITFIDKHFKVDRRCPPDLTILVTCYNIWFEE